MDAGSGSGGRQENDSEEHVDPGDVASISAAHALVVDRIARACRRASRAPDDVQLIAVAKTVPPERLRAAVASGLSVLGENRVQEAVAKASAVPGAIWHLIGPLQSNKARRAVETFAAIQTVESIDLAKRLDRLAGELRPGDPLPVLLQVNVDDDPAKAGFAPTEIGPILGEILALRNLRVDGLMTVGHFVHDPEAARPTFTALRRLSDALRNEHPSLGRQLSMGMSDDFEIAIEEGATMVRVGRALFGARPGGPV